MTPEQLSTLEGYYLAIYGDFNYGRNEDIEGYQKSLDELNVPIEIQNEVARCAQRVCYVNFKVLFKHFYQ